VRALKFFLVCNFNKKTREMNHQLQSGQASGTTAGGFVGAMPQECTKYFNNRWLVAQPGSQTTTVPAGEVLAGATISTLLVNAADCMYDYGAFIGNYRAATSAYTTA
jgi:hypothetical protein